MAEETLKARVRAKLLRQIAEDGGEQTEDDDDPRLIALEGDLAALDEAGDDDALVEELAARYWVP